MRTGIHIIRKLVVLAIGLPLLALGVVLIPLPGPGILVCLLAFFILSLEFEGARKYFDKLWLELKKVYTKARSAGDRFEKKHQ